MSLHIHIYLSDRFRKKGFIFAPFASDHVEQVTAAEQLYGRQLTFRISHGELRSELNLLSEAYSPDILQRAERVLLEQKRKHSWLF